jgi:hypothetical protein
MSLYVVSAHEFFSNICLKLLMCLGRLRGCLIEHALASVRAVISPWKVFDALLEPTNVDKMALNCRSSVSGPTKQNVF